MASYKTSRRILVKNIISIMKPKSRIKPSEVKLDIEDYKKLMQIKGKIFKLFYIEGKLEVI